MTRTAFTDVMNQLYGGNIQSALSSLGCATPGEALAFFGDIQHQLYAA